MKLTIFTVSSKVFLSETAILLTLSAWGRASGFCTISMNVNAMKKGK